MKTLTAFLAIGITAVAISFVCSGAVYAGQTSDSPFTLLSTSTPTTTPHVFLVKGGKGGKGGKGFKGGHHGFWKGGHWKWGGYYGGWWPYGRFYYGPAYCSNLVWDGYEYKCYDEFDDDW